MKKFVKLFKFISFYIFISILIGLFVGLYQLGLTYVIKGAEALINSNLIVLNILYFVIIICLSIVNYFILKFDSDIDGTGTLQIIDKIKNNKKQHNKLGILTIIVNSYVSTFSLMPLGGEAPSVVLASRIGDLGLELFKYNDREDILEACFGAGFGCAFLSPISGFFYFIEQGKTLSFKRILKASVIIILSFIVTFFINKHHIIKLVNVNMDINMNYIYVLLLIGVLCILFSFLFIKLSYLSKRFFSKHSNNFIVKYRSFLLFIISSLLGFFFINMMGSGIKTIDFMIGYSTLWIICLIFIFRFLLTIVFGLGKVSGGLVVPTMAIGGIIGYVICLSFNKANMFNLDYSMMYIIISMLLFYSLVFDKPLTGASLFLSAYLYSSNNLIDGIPLIFIVFFILILFSKINKLLKNDNYFKTLSMVDNYLA